MVAQSPVLPPLPALLLPTALLFSSCWRLADGRGEKEYSPGKAGQTVKLCCRQLGFDVLILVWNQADLSDGFPQHSPPLKWSRRVHLTELSMGQLPVTDDQESPPDAEAVIGCDLLHRFLLSAHKGIWGDLATSVGKRPSCS